MRSCSVGMATFSGLSVEEVKAPLQGRFDLGSMVTERGRLPVVLVHRYAILALFFFSAVYNLL